MGLHLTPFEERMEPPEYDDPLEHVEHPRERKPWKRDRHAIQFAMQGAINRRCWANTDRNGQSLDHSLRFRWQNWARHEVRRCLLGIDKPKRMHFAARHEFYLRLHRYVIAPRRFDKPPLPADEGREADV